MALVQARPTATDSLGRAMSEFVDEAQLNVRGGDGGSGVRLVPA